MASRKGTGNEDNLLGGGDSDFLLGLGGADTVSGEGGDDTVDGGGGNDTLLGGSGKDRLNGGDGNDRLDGGADDDNLDGGAEKDILLGGSGDDVAHGGSGDDTLSGGSGRDFLIAGSGDDKLTWDPNDYVINGGVGFDTLNVSGGTVSLIGETNLRNIEAVDMRARGANTLVLDAASVLNATDGRHLLRIFGDADDTLELAGSWNRVRSPVKGFTRFISGSAKVDVDDHVSVLFGNHLSLANINGVNGVHIEGANVLASHAGDINGDGLDDLLLGAPTSVHAHDPGAAFVVFGKGSGLAPDIDLEHLKSRQGVRLNGAADEHYTGTKVSIVGDVNHDGFDDFAVVTATLQDSMLTSLRSYVVFGHGGSFPTALDMTRLNGDNGYIVDKIPTDEVMGFALSINAAGDFNGDGFEDFAIGLPNAASNSAVDGGAALIVFGAAAPYDSIVDIRVQTPSEGWRINGPGNFSSVGSQLASGDINGDGFDDLLITSGQSREPVYVVFGKATGFDNDLSLAALDGSNGFALTSAHTFNHVAAVDINGDGFADVVMQDSTTNAYSVRVVFGHDGPFASSVSTSQLNGTNGFSIVAPAADRMVYAMSSAGDVNGDGYEDLLLGMPNATANHRFNAGATYVIFGHGGTFDAQLNLASMDIHQGLRIDGFSTLQLSGRSAAAAGDLNGDGFGDIVISGEEIIGVPNGIAPIGSYVIYGRDFDHRVAFNGTAGNDTLNGSVGAEALVGGRGNDVLDGLAGSDSLIGGAGNDTLVWDAADHRVDGGGGFDTLRVDGADVTLDLGNLPSQIITGINAVDLTGSGDNHLRLSLQDLLQLTDNSALRVAGDAGDSVEMTTSGWTQLADRNVGSNAFHAYINSSATLLVDTDITLIIA